MRAISFIRSTLAACLALGLAFLLSFSGCDSGAPPADVQTPNVAAAAPGSSATADSHKPPPAAATATAPKAEPESFLKTAEAPPPSFPGLPGTVTKAPEWAIKNAPFDVGAYFTAPADNAAPLYLDALFEFDPEAMKYCLSPEEVARRGPSAKERAKRASELIDAYDKNPKAVAPMKIAALVAEYERAFQLLATAQQRKACVFESGTGHLAQIPHLNAARTAGRLIALRILSDLARGDLNGAIGGVELQLRLSRDIRSRGGLVGGLVSMGMDRRLYRESIPQILAAPDLTKAHCDQLLQALARRGAESDLVRGVLQGEYVSLRSLLRPEVHEFLLELAAHPEFFPGGADGRAYTILADKAARMTQADFDAQIEAINDWYRALERLSQMPWPQRGDEATVRADEEAMRSRSPQLPSPNPLLATFFPSDGAFFHAVDRERTFHRGTQCLIALRLWQLDNTSPPTDLEAIIKAAGMTAIPIDPYSDTPLKMTVVNGETVIYSVGFDGQDDQARIECDPNVMQSRGDIVFRLPPPSDRIHVVKPVARKWTDKAGTHSIVAELIEVKDGAVRLKRQDGKIVTLPVEKFSDADQAYLLKHSHQDAGKP